MMRNKRIEHEQDGIDTLIGRGCRIEGDIVFRGGLWVDGHIIGNVRAEPQGAGYLIVPPQGRIEGDVCARHIVVSGEVVGNLHASDRVELLARARIIGNVSYGGMTMQAGCSVIGRLLQVDESNIPDERASLSAAPRARGYNLKLLIYKAGAFT
jgi:cytoskeletal protein CcmA (bactofilin family)